MFYHINFGKPQKKFLTSDPTTKGGGGERNFSVTIFKSVFLNFVMIFVNRHNTRDSGKAKGRDKDKFRDRDEIRDRDKIIQYLLI